MTKPITSREVAIAFLLADFGKGITAMAHDASQEREWLAMLSAERERLSALPVADLLAHERISIYKPRQRRFKRGSWELGRVELERCKVWPSSSRPWCDGSVADAVAKLGNSDHRVRDMATIAEKLVAQLPLVALRFEGDPTRFRLDDGTHRAIALYIAGAREAPAYIGTVPADCNERW